LAVRDGGEEFEQQGLGVFHRDSAFRDRASRQQHCRRGMT